jgi:hypothetical protein
LLSAGDHKKKRQGEMKMRLKALIAVALVLGFSVAAHAQTSDEDARVQGVRKDVETLRTMLRSTFGGGTAAELEPRITWIDRQWPESNTFRLNTHTRRHLYAALRSMSPRLQADPSTECKPQPLPFLRAHALSVNVADRLVRIYNAQETQIRGRTLALKPVLAARIAALLSEIESTLDSILASCAETTVASGTTPAQGTSLLGIY